VGGAVRGIAVGRSQPGGGRRGHQRQRPGRARDPQALVEAGVDDGGFRRRVCGLRGPLHQADCDARRADRAVRVVQVTRLSWPVGQKKEQGSSPARYLNAHHVRQRKHDTAAVALTRLGAVSSRDLDREEREEGLDRLEDFDRERVPGGTRMAGIVALSDYKPPTFPQACHQPNCGRPYYFLAAVPGGVARPGTDAARR